MTVDDISVSGHHLALENRAATLPDIKPCLSRNVLSPRSNKELIDELILGRPVPKQFLLKWPPGTNLRWFDCRVKLHFFLVVDHLTKPQKDLRGIPKVPLDPQFMSLPRHKWGATEVSVSKFVSYL